MGIAWNIWKIYLPPPAMLAAIRLYWLILWSFKI